MDAVEQILDDMLQGWSRGRLIEEIRATRKFAKEIVLENEQLKKRVKKLKEADNGNK